jgi:drug/metabolite transporter (DMT)-like permease
MENRFISAVRGAGTGAALTAGATVAVVVALSLVNQVVNVGATACFAASAHADRLRTFVFWQVIGGFFGLGVQLSFAGLVRFWSLTAANVIGIGVAFVSAQMFAAYLIFNESFHTPQWLGTAFVFVGVVLVAVGHRW